MWLAVHAEPQAWIVPDNADESSSLELVSFRK